MNAHEPVTKRLFLWDEMKGKQKQKLLQRGFDKHPSWDVQCLFMHVRMCGMYMCMHMHMHM